MPYPPGVANDPLSPAMTLPPPAALMRIAEQRSQRVREQLHLVRLALGLGQHVTQPRSLRLIQGGQEAQPQDSALSEAAR